MLSGRYWIVPLLIGGAIFGSFLNVVIYRLPRGLSISRPRRSHCLHCGQRIRAHHNVPVIGYLLLRGRCYDCAAPISLIYPVIECATALLFLSVWDALFIARVFPEMGHLSSDWPIAIAVLVLFCGLLATSVMDIESYTIDIRISVLTMIVGVACHAVWGLPSTDSAVGNDPGHTVWASGGAGALEPRPAADEGRLPPALCLIGAAMGLTWCLTALIGMRVASIGRRNAQTGDEAVGSLAEAEPPPPEEATAYIDTGGQGFQPLTIIAFALGIGGLAVWVLFFPTADSGFSLSAGPLRGVLGIASFMLLLILASLVPRESDERIIEEITAESPRARSVVLRESLWLLPAVFGGIGVLAYLLWTGRMDEGFAELLSVQPAASGWFDPLQAALRAVACMCLAAGMGWFVRIIGSLAFGKEAFGTGDIYIMASIGAVLGFWSVVFAFFLAAVLALVGVLATLLRKRSRAVPFGPWLALGAFTTLWAYGSLVAFFKPVGRLLWTALSG